jgi:hypothetical protein
MHVCSLIISNACVMTDLAYASQVCAYEPIVCNEVQLLWVEFSYGFKMEPIPSAPVKCKAGIGVQLIGEECARPLQTH